MEQQNYSEVIPALEGLWSGSLSRARDGIFTTEDDRIIRETLGAVDIGEPDLMPRAFVTLLWFMPQFMEWQISRVAERTNLDQEYRNLCLWVSERIGEILGNP